MSHVPPKLCLRLEHDEARARTLLRQVIGAADAGDAGADDQHVEVLGGRGGGADLSLDVHGGFYGWPEFRIRSARTGY